MSHSPVTCGLAFTGRQFSSRSGRFAVGFAAVPRAVGMILCSPKMMALAAVPAVISLIILLGLIVLSVGYGDDMLRLLWSPPSEPESWWMWTFSVLHVITEWLARLVFIALSVVFTFFLSLVVAEPFVDLLSETTEERLGSLGEAAPFRIAGLLVELRAALGDVSLDVGVLLLLQIPIFALLLIPFVGGFLHVVVQSVIGAFFTGLEITSSALGRRGFHGRQRWRILLSHEAEVLGIGSGVLIIMFVPLAQLLTFPIAVVAGTIAVVEIEGRGGLI